VGAGLIVVAMINPYQHAGVDPLSNSMQAVLGDMCGLTDAAARTSRPSPPEAGHA
jgi:hypothetical protein